MNMILNKLDALQKQYEELKDENRRYREMNQSRHSQKSSANSKKNPYFDFGTKASPNTVNANPYF